METNNTIYKIYTSAAPRKRIYFLKEMLFFFFFSSPIIRGHLHDSYEM